MVDFSQWLGCFIFKTVALWKDRESELLDKRVGLEVDEVEIAESSGKDEKCKFVEKEG